MTLTLEEQARIQEELARQNEDLEEIRRLGRASFMAWLTGFATAIGIALDKVMEFFGPYFS